MKKEQGAGDSVQAAFHEEEIVTYALRAPANLPMFFEKKPYQGASGKLYPLPFIDGITDEKKPCKYQVATLENEYIKVRLLPQIGGKIQQAYDKLNGYDFIYHNRVIKPAMIGLGGPWISGGIEFNWPQHHRPTTFLPVEAVLEEGKDGEKTVWIGETEPFARTRAVAGVTVCPGRSYIKLQVRVHNTAETPQPFMWWANLAVPVNDSYQFVFPKDVEFVNDHDRRAVISWPVAKGVYNTARKFDYGEGKDLSLYPNVTIQSSFMVSKGQSAMDFLSGYDHARQAGIVTIANHHIAPGKKLFHWGKHPFGKRWCENLTDEDGPYVELMTGVYTDNQPDFTWIMPNETKCFEQYWYPIREIGCIQNATQDAALSLEAGTEGVRLGIQATGRFDGCTLTICKNGVELWRTNADLTPQSPWIQEITELAGEDETELSAEVRWNGRRLVASAPYRRGQKNPIAPRTPAPRPEEIQSLEELYLHGAHLVQYKHHTYAPENYFMEALKRDPKDLRCNTAMGNRMLARGLFDEAERFYKQAIDRLTLRNDNPADTEALYQLGITQIYQGKLGEAYDNLYRSVWSYSYASPGYYQLALLDARKELWEEALEKLELSLKGNRDDVSALTAKACMLRKRGALDQALETVCQAEKLDPLDILPKLEKRNILQARGESSLAETLADEIRSQYAGKAEYFVDAARLYLRCGLYEDALRALESAAGENPLVQYYSGYCWEQLGETAAAQASWRRADALRDSFSYPAQLADIPVLQSACRMEQSAFAHYLLGCLYYDRFRYQEAADAWRETLKQEEGFAPAHRNLAIALFDKLNDPQGARAHMERAFALAPENDRIFYEYQQLLKNLNVQPAERIALFEKHPALTHLRDDCLLEYATLLTQTGRLDDAVRAMEEHAFHTYEGGEGKVTKHHAWLHLLRGEDRIKSGDLEGAEEALQAALVFPQNYGEGKSYFAQENHIYLALAELYRRQGRRKEAEEAMRRASENQAVELSEINYFQSLAMRALGDRAGAEKILREMLEEGTHTLENADLYGYFGVGTPTPLPFEYDQVKNNQIKGRLMRGFALHGLGQYRQAEEEIQAVRALAPYHFLVFVFERVLQQENLGFAAEKVL